MLDPLLEKHLKPLGMRVTDGGSDGDARRDEIMQAQMKELDLDDPRTFTLVGGKLFTLSAERIQDESGALGNIVRLHMQDPLHNSKKLDSFLFRAPYSVQVGAFVAKGSDLKLVSMVVCVR